MSVLLQYQLNQLNQGDVQRVREALFRLGGLNICPDGLGHLFREELSKFKFELGFLQFRKYFRHVCLFGGELFDGL